MANTCTWESEIITSTVTFLILDLIGRFHARGRTNHLHRQIISDEQVVWCANGRKKFSGSPIIWYLAVWKDDFFKTICPSRRTSWWQNDINSHQTDKCQTICPSRQFVRPPVWKQPTNNERFFVRVLDDLSMRAFTLKRLAVLLFIFYFHGSSVLIVMYHFHYSILLVTDSNIFPAQTWNASKDN